MRINLSDLPPSYQLQAQRQINPRTLPDVTQEPLQPVGRTTATPKTVERAKRNPTRILKAPNKTEARYLNEIIKTTPNATLMGYEALTFRMANGHRYTPDWVFLCGGVIICVEVKGSYKFGSHQRARLAFDQAKTEFPQFQWTWATLTKEGWNTNA